MYVNSIINNIYSYRHSIYVCRHKNLQRFMVCSYRTACFRDRLMPYLYGYKTINGDVSMEVIKITKKVYKAIGCEKDTSLERLHILKSCVRVLICQYKRLASAVGTNSNQKIIFLWQPLIKVWEINFFAKSVRI